MLAALIIHLDNKNKALESEIEEFREMVSLGYFTLDGKERYLPASTSNNIQQDDFIELFSHKKQT
ncbi:hypothetical protein [Providencia burhodogranariea]|uniref:Uncharacterized protein n=1 Tax=Providencia burhodogranariea DSM 19968 TaxID=1141662 RepID=K8WEZ0_9GAMM|nr:hypothetical protein [Providencia burhodogranariea]EKT56032.1 hypothetical protein OOA_15507 [Providencia burhodogranariea DSM 19968]